MQINTNNPRVLADYGSTQPTRACNLRASDLAPTCLPTSVAGPDMSVYCEQMRGRGSRLTRALLTWVGVLAAVLSAAGGYSDAQARQIFRDLIDRSLLAYIDDLLIHAKTREEHDQVLLEVLKRLRDNNLAINLAKCV